MRKIFLVILLWLLIFPINAIADPIEEKDEFNGFTVNTADLYENEYDEFSYPRNDKEIFIPTTDKQTILDQLKERSVSEDGAYYVALHTIKSMALNDSEFSNIWTGIKLLKPNYLYDIDGEQCAFLFGIVSPGNRMVGEIVVCGSMQLPPVFEMSDSQKLSTAVSVSDKVIITRSGYILDKRGELKTLEEGFPITKDLYKVTMPESYSADEIKINFCQWQYLIESIESDNYQIVDNVSEVASTLPTICYANNITQDYTWHKNCAATAVSVLMDWYGRYKDPLLFEASRPHSRKICELVWNDSSYFAGSSPSGYEVECTIYGYIDDHSDASKSVTRFDYTNYSSSQLFTLYKNAIYNYRSPQSLGYVGHSFVGYGYSGNYYKVRDTWTGDGMSDGGSRFLYNSTSYNYTLIRIYMADTAWRTGTIQIGDTNLNVRRLKTMLYELWYYSGTINNTFDNATKAALINFQNDYGLTADGICGPATYTMLISAHGFISNSPRTLQYGVNGDDVAEMQARIRAFCKAQGYSLIDCDGSFGNLTKATLIKFQAYKGLTQDGICGSATRNALLNTSFPVAYD